MNENTSVDIEQQESVQADAAQAPVAESSDVIALTELMDTVEEAPAEETQDPVVEQQPAEEQPVSGGMKGRLNAAEEKGRKRGYDDGYAAAKAEFDAERAKWGAKLAKLEEIELKESAAELVKEGVPEALAMRFARMERGLPAQQTEAPKASQPRDENGRFVKAEQPDASVQERAQRLSDQAKLVQRLTGVDVAGIFREDKSVQQRIVSGEIDFADLAEEYKNAAPPKKSAPPVVRSASGSTVKSRGFGDLSDEAFDQLQEQLSLGKSLDLRR